MSDVFDKIKKSADSQSDVNMPVGAWNEFQSYGKKRNKKGAFLWSRFIPLSLLGLLFITNVLWWTKKNNNFDSVSSYNRIDTVYVDRFLKTSSMQEQERSTQVADLNSINHSAENNQFRSTASVSKNQQNEIALAISTINRLERKVNGLINKVDQLERKNNVAENKIYDLLTQRANNQEMWADHELIAAMNDELSLLEYIEYLNAYPVETGYSDFELMQPDPIDYNIDYKKSVRSFIKPDYYSIGINGGLFLGENQKYGNEKGYTFGMEGSTYFNNNIRLNGKINLTKSISKINDLEGYENIPEPNEPDDGTLSHLEIDSQSLLYVLSLDYIFGSKNKIRPYVGIGYAYQQSKYKKFNFEYYSPNGEEYQQIEVEDNISRSNNLSFNLGIDMDVSKNMYLKINSTLFGNLEDNKVFYYFTPGLNYRF